MVQIKEIVNSIFTSKTYILHKDGEKKAWLVDIGDIDTVQSFLIKKQLIVAGVFITHGHFDHIYGLQSLMNHYPDCKVYISEYGKEALASDKLNMSRYHESPVKYDGDNIVIVHEGETMKLFEHEPEIQFYETPGHNPGCLTMIIGNFVFTGDAYIPSIGANTQIRYADKELAKMSLDRILNLAKGKIILSGHQVENL